MIERIEWHRHSEFSHVVSMDGLGDADQFAERAVELGMPALGLTDHGTLAGVLHHIKACRERRILPIVGVEAYFRPDRRAEKAQGVENASKAGHLCLHAANRRGWRNLLAITSAAWTTGGQDGLGYYGKPVADWQLLKDHSEGIICTTACVFSPVIAPYLDGDAELARSNFMQLREIYGERLWVEIMPHDFELQGPMNRWAIGLADETGTGLLATGDVHIVRKEWKRAHEIFQMHATGQTFESQAKKKEAGEEVYGSTLDTLHLMTADELRAAFLENHPDIYPSRIDEAIANSREAVKQVRLWMIDSDEKFPEVKGDPITILDSWIAEGLEIYGKADDPVYLERVAFERETLVKNKVVPYFCIVGDLVRWAQSDAPLPATEDDPEPKPKRPIRSSARGSAAGCLISYLLGITTVDPIAYDLLFERFLNPDRKGMPDIDLDFTVAGRELVKEYLRRTYGYDHVADVRSHQFFAPRSLVSDLGRVFGVPYVESEKVRNSISYKDRGWEKTKSINKDLAALAEKYSELDAVAKILDDQLHRGAKHAAAVVITPRPVGEDIPLELQKSKKEGERGTILTAWSNRADFEIISDFGFLKLDVLGVEDLDRQDYFMDRVREREERDARNPYKRNREPRIDPKDLPIRWDPSTSDPKVMKAFADGHTCGIFQFHTGGMTNLLRAIKPTNVLHLIAANALYRPGAMDYAYEYARRKNGEVPESEWYWHPSVEPFMKETFGILCFQEQVMKIVQALGNFTPGQADTMRKAISKWYRLGIDECKRKIRDELGAEDRWFVGCEANGISRGDAETIWNNIMDFAGYGFNKSHSACYAIEAYQGMHAKFYDPHEEYASMLSLPDDDDGFVQRVIRESHHFGVSVKPPDVIRSDMGFTMQGGDLIYGLLGIKNVGDAAAHEIFDNRPYASYGEFCRKCPGIAGGVGKSLIRAGAFDALDGRAFLMSELRKGEKPHKVIRFECGEDVPCKSQKKLDEAQCPTHGADCGRKSIRDVWDMWTVADHINHNRKLKTPRPLPAERTEPSTKEMMEAEKDALGVLISVRPTIERHWNTVKDYVDTYSDFEAAGDGDDIQIAGEVVKVKPWKTKKNQQPMAFLDLAVGADQYSCTLFTDSWLRFADVLEEADSVIISGRKNVYNGKEGIIVNRLQNLEDFVVEVGADAA